MGPSAGRDGVRRGDGPGDGSDRLASCHPRPRRKSGDGCPSRAGRHSDSSARLRRRRRGDAAGPPLAGRDVLDPRLLLGDAHRTRYRLHPGDPDGADYPEAIGTNMPLTPLSLLAASDPLDHVLRHDLFHLGPIAVSNQMVMAVVAALLMLLMFPMLFNRAHSGPPSGARNF